MRVRYLFPLALAGALSGLWGGGDGLVVVVCC